MRIIGTNGRERIDSPSGDEVEEARFMKAKLHQIECDEGELLELPDHWIPVRLEHNDYATPQRKAFTLYVLERS